MFEIENFEPLHCLRRGLCAKEWCCFQVMNIRNSQKKYYHVLSPHICLKLKRIANAVLLESNGT